MFLFYILISRLSICQPVAIETEVGYYFLFTETGVEVLSAKLFDMGQSSRIWALSNSSHLLNKPSQALMASPKKEVYLLHASSPQESHWKEWAKERGVGIHEMDVWQPDELLALEYVIYHTYRQAHSLTSVPGNFLLCRAAFPFRNCA